MAVALCFHSVLEVRGGRRSVSAVEARCCSGAPMVGNLLASDANALFKYAAAAGDVLHRVAPPCALRVCAAPAPTEKRACGAL